VIEKYVYKILFQLILFLNVFIYISCKKEVHLTEYSVSDLKINVKLRKIVFTNDSTIFVCGGNKNEFGVIFKTTDNGKHWNRIFSKNNYSINDIFFLNDSIGYACGDNLMLLKTTDSGNDWFNEWNYSFSNWQSYITPLQCILFINKDTGFVSGGADYSKGVICETYNGGRDWVFSGSDNEQKSIFFTNNLTGFFSGYGIIQKTVDAAKQLEILNVSGDYYTSVFFTGNETGFACGFNGSIYKTTNAGKNWTEVLKVNNIFKKRIHLNYIFFINNISGYAVGNEGVFLKTNNSGDTWIQYVIDKKLNMYSLSVNSHNEMFIACDGGKIIKIGI